MSKTQQQRSQFIMLFFAFSFGMILSNLLGQKSESKVKPDELIMVYRGIDKHIDDLPEVTASKIREIRHDADTRQREMLYTVALTWHLEEFAAKQALPIEEAGNQLFDLAPPTEDEVNAFYIAQADKIGKPFYEVKEGIFQHLTRQKAKKAREDKIAELLEKGDLAVMLK